MNIHYIKASLDDIELLKLIYDASFYQDFIRYGECPGYHRTTESFEKSIKKSHLELIYLDEIPVGAVSCYAYPDGYYFIGCLCIIPEYQNRGIGRDALNHLKQIFPDWCAFDLVTPADNERNVHFYLKNGFSILNREMDGTVEVAHFQMKRK